MTPTRPHSPYGVPTFHPHMNSHGRWVHACRIRECRYSFPWFDILVVAKQTRKGIPCGDPWPKVRPKFAPRCKEIRWPFGNQNRSKLAGLEHFLKLKPQILHQVMATERSEVQIRKLQPPGCGDMFEGQTASLRDSQQRF